MQIYNVHGHHAMRHQSGRTAADSERDCASEAGRAVFRCAAAKPSPTFIIGLVLAVALTVVIPHVFSMAVTPPAVQYVEVTVLPGQTLWQIAGEHKGERTDTRRMVDRIRTANELSNASVYPGQVLRIPVTP